MNVYQMAGHEIDDHLHTGAFVNLSGERRLNEADRETIKAGLRELI